MSATGLRVLTWNVHDMLGDPLAVARVIASASPDVVCLQEAPRWPGSRSRLGALARASGTFYVAGGRASAGTAVLSSLRTAVHAYSAFRLPTQGFRTRPRGAVTAQVSLPGCGSVLVASVHLGLTPGERADHVARLVSSLGGPLVVAGDLNEAPDGPSWLAFSSRVADPRPDAPPTHPARAPRRRIDAVLVESSLTVSEYASWQPDPDDARLASDHLPILAVVELPPAR